MHNIPYHVYTHVIMINGYVVPTGSADKFCLFRLVSLGGVGSNYVGLPVNGLGFMYGA